jgi:hypothetical protein
MLATTSRIFLRTATGIGGKTAVRALVARAGTSYSYSTNNVSDLQMVQLFCNNNVTPSSEHKIQFHSLHFQWLNPKSLYRSNSQTVIINLSTNNKWLTNPPSLLNTMTFVEITTHQWRTVDLMLVIRLALVPWASMDQVLSIRIRPSSELAVDVLQLTSWCSVCMMSNIHITASN